MAKKTKKSNKSLLNSLLVVLGISLFLFGFVVFKNNQESSDVKGVSTTVSLSCNMSVHPARTCPSGYECKNNTRSNPRLVGSDGVCMKQNLAKEGEACGRSINQACRKDLICAPLGQSYKLLNTQATEVESTTESEGISVEEKTCIGKSEDEIKSGCFPYIPYYGACVKKGVWPPPPQKPTPTPGPCYQPRICSGNTCTGGPPVGINGVAINMPQCTPTPTPSSGCIPKPPCVDGIPDPKTGIKMYCDPKPGTIFCTPTPSKLSPTLTPPGQVTCVWCGLNCVDKSKIQACIMIAPPKGYSCVYKNNACVKELITPSPTPPSGCRYEQVQCIQAPCDPILKCSMTSVAPIQRAINGIQNLLIRNK
jgi:hypothetical protein